MAQPIIITRADKGAALTWEEGDANFINLQAAALPTGGTTGQVLVKTVSGDYGAEFQDIVTALEEDLNPKLGGTLNVNGHNIESINANVPILLDSGESYITVGKSDIAQEITAKVQVVSTQVDINASETLNLTSQQTVGLSANNSVSIQSPYVILNSTVWPATIGAEGQVLATDAGANLVWTDPGIAAVVNDTAPRLGGALDTNGFAIIDSTLVNLQAGADSVTMGGGTVTIQANANNTSKISLRQIAGFGYIDVVASGPIKVDTTDNVSITAPAVKLNNITYPTADGTIGQVLATNGGALLEWVDPQSGPQGIQGYTGSQGAAGADGIQGIQGPIGYTGSKGDTGAQGIAGTDGAQGIQGIQGFTGYTGSQGIQGIQGVIGFTGSQGIQGEAGPQGIQGFIGFTGSQGVAGVAGADGAQGIQGIQGFTGSKGDTGAAGADGIQGIQGSIGFTGSKGDTGVAGADGIQGIQGPIGFTGSQGIQGEQGIQGPIGFTGSQGIKGDTGAAGTNGTDGAAGTQGPIGFTGSQGIQGPAGSGGITINDSATTSTTETWSANKLYTTLGDIQTALTTIIG